MQIGAVLPMMANPETGLSPPWEEMRRMALAAETMGFDTVWVPDELLWRVPSWPAAAGWWEGVSILGAVAEATSSIHIGSWVLSALHRNPGLTAKVAATLDEISGGRFLLGFGAGHAGKQGKAFGYPEDKVVSRYEEALQIVVPLLREGRADFDGEHHSSSDLEQAPTGPRPGDIPIVLAGHGSRTMGLAAKHADIWSGFATESSLPEAFAEMLANLDRACEDHDRDPASLGRSLGVVVEPTDEAGNWEMGIPISGSSDEIADQFERFADMGVTSLELMIMPPTKPAWEQAGEALRAFRAL